MDNLLSNITGAAIGASGPWQQQDQCEEIQPQFTEKCHGKNWLFSCFLRFTCIQLYRYVYNVYNIRYLFIFHDPWIGVCVEVFEKHFGTSPCFNSFELRERSESEIFLLQKICRSVAP